MKTTVLIDADTLVYEAAHANEQSTQWDESTFTRTANFDLARRQLDDNVTEIMEKLSATDCVMCLSDYNDPWRKKVMPSYKENRKLTLRPLLFAPLREYIHEKYDAFQRPGLEADDVLGILATNPTRIAGRKIVVSIDKDLLTVPGHHCNMTQLRRWSGKAEFVGDGSSTTVTVLRPEPFHPMVRAISEEEADYKHYTQALTGDRVDGYPGCPGVGPVKAKRALAPAWVGGFDKRAAWSIIVSLYEAKSLTADHALESARVARICRHEDYDYTSKQVRLWNPPS